MLFKEVLPADIMKLKREPGRDMLIYGSASLAQTLTNHGLIDEYRLLVHPVVFKARKAALSEHEGETEAKAGQTITSKYR